MDKDYHSFFVFKYYVNTHPVHIVKEEIIDEEKAIEYANQHLSFADSVEIYKTKFVKGNEDFV